MIANDMQHFPLNSNFRHWNSLTWIKTIQVNEKSISVFNG